MPMTFSVNTEDRAGGHPLVTPKPRFIGKAPRNRLVLNSEALACRIDDMVQHLQQDPKWLAKHCFEDLMLDLAETGLQLIASSGQIDCVHAALEEFGYERRK